MKCPKCKGYDVDVCPELDADFQCGECGHKIKRRVRRRTRQQKQRTLAKTWI